MDNKEGTYEPNFSYLWFLLRQLAKNWYLTVPYLKGFYQLADN
jgi:hypothetical protein